MYKLFDRKRPSNAVDVCAYWKEIKLLPWSFEIVFHHTLRGLSVSVPWICYANLFVTSPMKRGFSGRAFIPCSGHNLGLIWLSPSRFSRALCILIRTCFSCLPLDAANKGTSTRYSKVRATAEGEGRYYQRITGIISRLPSLQVLLSMLENVWTEVFHHLPRGLNTHLPTPLSHSTCTPPINSYHLYMLPNSTFYTCGFFRPFVAQ